MDTTTEYEGRHRPTNPIKAATSKVIGDARDRLVRFDGYEYLPRHATPEVTEATVLRMTR